MVVGEPSIHNIMGGMESTGGVRLHNHKRKLKQRFDIIKKLGQGTYGKVQLGINKETGQEVAIKTIKKCKIETEADLIRIRREIQIMSSVQHPNIIHIYEVFENREKMVLVMEYAAGGELYDYLSERKVLTEEEARRIFRQITIAVFYCHKHKICHRDLKLENILLDQTGNAKIADFGLSNVFDDRRLLNTFCGSPLYASPEIVKGTPYHGPEVDCWSLGVLLYTLVYGAMPFDGSNFKRLTRQISASDYFEPKNPSPASPLIKDMLTKCPSRRSDIERICSHWWVNEGYDQNCLDIAEDLAAQTPVRLDLLLSLVPQSASADKLVVGDPQPTEVAQSMSSENVVPTRCHSVGSLMELDRNNCEKIREMVEEDPKSSNSAATSGVPDAKRKLETTPSMEETVAAGSKRKERSRRKEKSDEREPRAYRSSSRHHSAPIANAITEEQMEVDLRDPESADAMLELIKEAQSQSHTPIKERSKERSKTPIIPDVSAISNDQEENIVNKEMDNSSSTPILPVEVQKPKEPKTPKSSPKKSTKVKSATSSPKKFEVSEVKTSPIESGEKVKGAECLPELPKSEKIEEKLKKSDVKTKKADENLQQADGQSEIKKLREKAVSLDSEEVAAVPPTKPVERRRSKIFETAEKFNQLAAATEIEKPKKIYIPGVNVGGAKRVFERKASLGSAPPSPPVKQSASKVIIDVPVEKKSEKGEEKTPSLMKTDSIKSEDEKKKEDSKKRAVDIITGALGKPPVSKKLNGSPPLTPQSTDPKKLGLKIQLGPNDVRNATISVTTPVETKYPDFENVPAKPVAIGSSVPTSPEIQNRPHSPTLSSKMEITLKSATLPRRKTSKAEITLAGYKPNDGASFKSEVEAKINAFQPIKLRTQRSEVAFPVAAVVHQQSNRSSSLEPDSRMKSFGKERIIPIQVEGGSNESSSSISGPSKPPLGQRSMSQRSNSLSRQSTADSDTDSAVGSTAGHEPIRKSPREYIIPISVEGGGYVTPRSGSLEPESKNSTPTSANPPRGKFGRPKRMGSLLSDASEDESPFSTLHRDNDDILGRHMHRLRSSRPTRQAPEHADSLSSGEDDDDDGFELLTAENLFSTLLSRVRSLTQRLNVDDTRGSTFPSRGLLSRMGSNSSQGFWGVHEPLSRRITESPFRRSSSRDTDRFGFKDSAMSSNLGTSSNVGPRGTQSRDSFFDVGSGNTLPRDKSQCDEEDSARVFKDADSNGLPSGSLSSRDSYTPCLARRLSRQFIEQTRQSLPRSPSIPRERLYRSSTEEPSSLLEKPEYRSCSSDRSQLRDLRRTNSLLDSVQSDKFEQFDKFDQKPTTKRSVSLFEDDDELLPPLPRQIMTLGRKYRDPAKTSTNPIRRENLLRSEKIQEESTDDGNLSRKIPNNSEIHEPSKQSNSSISDTLSLNNSNTNLRDVTASLSAKSFDTSPVESTSNIQSDSMNSLKADAKEFECRLLAAENLIKESKLRNLGIQRFDPNLSSNYKDTDKCDKELIGSMSDLTVSSLSKRRSCIPSLRFRSGSLTRDVCWSSGDRRKTLACSEDSTASNRAPTPERSLLSKIFRSSSSSRDTENKEKSPKARKRISRFLRPDFFDTPREESQYVKDKEAQKAAENERRKSRFMRRKFDKLEGKDDKNENSVSNEEKPEKELKNEVNAMTRDKVEVSGKEKTSEVVDANPINDRVEKQSSKNSFLQSLEKKLEKLRTSDESGKMTNGGGNDKDVQQEISAPEVIQKISDDLEIPMESSCTENLVVPDPPISSTKSKVSSVLGLFKNDSKSTVNGTKPSSTLLSKFKKNTYKGSRSDTSVITGEPTNSKIPTKSKMEAKTETRAPRRIFEMKRSPDKSTEAKKSPPKEKSKEKTPPLRASVERKSSVEKSQSKSPKKLSPEKSIEIKSEKNEKFVSRIIRKSTPEKSDNKTSFVSRLSPKKNSPEKSIDNKSLETKGKEEGDEKKTIPIKRCVKSLTSLTKNGSLAKVDRGEEVEKKVKKIVKKEIVDKEEKTEIDGAKKKKIVRVVKKVVKKSASSSDNKSELKVKDKEKIGKSIMRKISSSKDKEKSPEIATKKEKSPENVIGRKEKSPTPIPMPKKSTQISNSLTNGIENGLGDIPATNTFSTEIPESQRSSTDPESNKVKPNRSNLKLDLSKIPQHTFKNPGGIRITPPKSDLSKPDSSRSIISSPNGKVSGDSSRMTHHATITGNKIVIDKPLLMEDFVELRRKSKTPTTTCEILQEKSILPKLDVNSIEMKDNTKDEINRMEDRTTTCEKAEKVPKEFVSPFQNNKKIDASISMKPKITPEITEDILSPLEDGESFDSWSICSNDFNHRVGSDIQSPTSPVYSPCPRGDHPESIIDRIRRKSFYSRFNERKRKSSINVPSSGASSSTLPRKFSFSSTLSKDLDIKRRNKPISSSYSSSSSPTRRNSERRNTDRALSMYCDELPSYRRSPIDRDRFSDIGSSIGSPSDPYGSSTSCYDPVRRYRISPIPDSSSHRIKYPSSDFSYESDLGGYKSPISTAGLAESCNLDYRNSLPRRYGTTSSPSSESKTAEYYEELLAPSRLEYLTSRKTTPVPGEYSGRFENGYHNGHVETPVLNSDKWRSYADKTTERESSEDSEKSQAEDLRCNSGNSETKELSAACPDAETSVSIE